MKKFLLSLLTILMLTTSLPVAPIMAEDEETHEHNHNHEEQEENAFLEQEGSFNSEEGEFVAENINPEIEELIYYCDKEEHLHDANCYKILNVLECKEDHLHADTCLKEIKFLICDKEEHLHTDECLDAEYKAKHEELITEPTEEEIALEQAKNGLEGYFLSCDKDEHEHSLDCYEYKEDLVCKNTSEDHEHSDECYSKYYVLSCDKEEHVHTIDCVSKQEEKYEYIDEIPDDLPKDEEINEETPLRMMLRGPLRGSNDTQIEIRQLNVQVFKGGKWIDDKYVKVPYDSAIGQRFAFRVNFALSGVGEIDAYDPQNTDSEGIKIVIPKQILRNRMGDLADTYEMSIPHISEINDDELDVDINYCYYEEGDNLVIVNFKERPAGDNGYFEIAYATSQTTFNYQDMGSSDDFYATLVAVNNGETTEPQESNHIPVYMDTTAKIDETYKDYPKKSDTWNSSWGSKPADADDYFYLEWDIRSYINDKATQPYNLTFTDITTSEYGTSEFVGYKARGSEQYITDNTVTNQTITGRRYDKVLTRHLKADFDPLDYYKIVNNIKVVLTPADLLDPETQASASRPYEYRYHEPVWKYPTGHFQVWKYADGSYRARKGYNVLNERRGTYSRYDLQDWKDSSLEIYDTFDWGVVMEGYPYPWTINAGSDIQDPASYGVTPVTFEVADNTLFFGETNQRQLTYEDYEIDTLNYGWSRTLDANMSFKIDNIGDTYPYYSTFKPQFNKETDIIYFYAELQNSNDYVLCATHDLRDNSVWFDSNYVVSVEPSTHSSYQIVFVDNVTGYKVKYDSSYYYTNIELCLNAHLKHSEYVDNYCADKMSIMWANTARGEFFDNRGETPSMVFSGDRTDWNYASETVIERDSWINKKVISATNNTKKKTYTIGWEVEMDERIKINDEPWEDVLQESGIFYDLLPSGAVLDKKSVSVKINGYYSDTYETRRNQDKISSGTYLKDNEIEVITIPNYKDTGRTLLIVKMPEANNYQLTYDTFHHWDSIKDFGDLVYNPIAYETGNEKIYRGSNNDGGNLQEKELMSNLGDNGNNAPTFIYSEAIHDILALTSAVSGLTKKVKDEKDKDYTYDTWTKNNGSYSYRLRYQNTFNNTAKNLIFFDSLENYIVDGNASDWYGSIESFDVAQLRAMGIEPKIYLSTITNFDLEQYNTFTDFDDVLLNSGDWIKLEDFGDLSEAKAYAIDCRKKTDGSDFVLDEGQSIQAVVYMRAPAGADDVNGTGLDYPETYNNIYIRNTITGIDGTPVDFYIHQDYTTVRFIVKNDISLEKVSSENIDTKIKDIKFRLTGTSDYGTEVDIIKITDRNGQIKFEDIEKGTYILQEYETTKDWLLDTTEHIVKINSDGSVTIDNEDYTNKQIVLENKPRIYTEVYLMKRREGDSAQDVEFKQMLVDSNIGDEIKYEGNTYIVTEKNGTRIKLEKPSVKYAVQIYGIGQDDLSDDNGATTYKSGLTFGPAIGENYFNSYKEHVPTGSTDGSTATDSQPHNHRCIHNDDWETIIYWNNLDPAVYEQCVRENCTHDIKLALSNELRDPNFTYIGTGDGISVLYSAINTGSKYWLYGNGNTKNGWGGSNVRAILNGVDDDLSDGIITEDSTYAKINNIDASKALVSSLPISIQKAVGNRKTISKLTWSYGTQTTYDKLFLFSPNEISDNIDENDYNHPTEAQNGKYQKFVGNDTNLKAYEHNISFDYWLRTTRNYNDISALYIKNTGELSYSNLGNLKGITLSFALNRSISLSEIQGLNDYLLINTEIKPQTPIANTTFKLSSTSDYGNDVLQILTTNSAGRLVFEDIEKGTYELREVSPNEDFILNETVWLVTIGEDRSVTVVAKEDEKDRLYEVGKDDTGKYNVVYNEPRYWNFTLRKIDKENETIWLEGATFSLKGISDLGTEYNLEVNSNENGRVIFNRIEKGTYLLTETKAPSGVDETGRVGGNRNYIADPKQYIVKIDHQGNVTIDGLSMNEYDDFEVKNDRALDGKITIIKKWEDTDPNKRVAPVVHLSTGEPEGLARVQITYDANGGLFENGKTVNKVIHHVEENNGNMSIISTDGEELIPANNNGYKFKGWFLDKNCTKKYTEDISNGKSVTVYAKYSFDTKYAVQVWGIGVDEDENGNKVGITFGPAVCVPQADSNKGVNHGLNYQNGYNVYSSYRNHIPSGKTLLNNNHRCIHDDDWETIIYWNNLDPYVYEQCLQERNRCTHSIELVIPDEIYNNDFIYNGPDIGDGISVLGYELTKNAKVFGSTSDGSYNWDTSYLRETLNGENSIFKAIPQIIQENIASVKNVSDSSITTYDKVFVPAIQDFSTSANVSMDINYSGSGDFKGYPIITVSNNVSYANNWYKYSYQNGVGNISVGGPMKTRNRNRGAIGYNYNIYSGGITEYRLSQANDLLSPVYAGISFMFALKTDYKAPVNRYAVSIYGIGQDVNIDNEYMGLTIGPAFSVTGDERISHNPTGITEDGNLHRCFHDDDWDTIIYWNNLDPYVYEQCIKNECTNTVNFNDENNEKFAINKNWGEKKSTNEPAYNMSGSGLQSIRIYYRENGKNALIYNDRKSSYRQWVGTTLEGWGASYLRALINGSDELTIIPNTNERLTYNPNYDSSSPIVIHTEELTQDVSLFEMMPENIKNAIGLRKTKYDKKAGSYTQDNVGVSYDKLFLLSFSEIFTEESFNNYKGSSNANYHYNEALEAGGVYQKFANKMIEPKQLKAYTGQRSNGLKYYGVKTAFRSVDNLNGYWNIQGLNGSGEVICPETNNFYYTHAEDRYISPAFALDTTYFRTHPVREPDVSGLDNTQALQPNNLLSIPESTSEQKPESFFEKIGLVKRVFAEGEEENVVEEGVYEGMTYKMVYVSDDVVKLYLGNPDRVEYFYFNKSNYPWQYKTLVHVETIGEIHLTIGDGYRGYLFTNISNAKVVNINLSKMYLDGVGSGYISSSAVLINTNNKMNLDIRNVSYTEAPINKIIGNIDICKKLVINNITFKTSTNSQKIPFMRILDEYDTPTDKIVIASLDEYNKDLPGTYIQNRIVAGYDYNTSTLTLGYIDPDNYDKYKIMNRSNIITSSSSNGLGYDVLNSASERDLIKKIEIVDKVKVGVNADNLFVNLKGLETITGLENLDTSETKRFRATFAGCESLKSIDLSALNINGSSGGYREMFKNTKSLKSIDISNFSADENTDIREMFYGSGVEEIKGFENFTIKGGLNDYDALSGANNLQTISIRLPEYNFNFGSVVSDPGSSIQNEQFTRIKDLQGNIVDDSPKTFKTITESGLYIRTSLLEPTQHPDGTYEWTSIDELWTDSGDGTWSYTFDVFDDSLTYYFWEEDMEGYESDIEWIPGYKVLNGSEGTIGYITNKSTEYGALDVYKEVEWVDEANPDLKFEFTITLSGSGIGGTQVFSDVIFTDGVGKIILKDGEHKLIEGLPDGTTYLVEEKEMTLFNTTSENEAGEISTGETEYVVFNNKEKKLRELRPEGDIAIRKKVVGSNKEDSYVVYGEFSNLDASMTYLTNNDLVIISDSTGKASIEFNILPDQEIVFYGLPVGAKYQFIEEAGNYISSYEILPVEEGDSINVNNSASANTKENVQLSTAEETLEENESAVVVFTNRYTVKQNLKVKKVVDGIQADKDNSYNFEIYFSNMEPLSYFNSDIGRIVADEDGEAVKGFSLTDRQEIVFEEIPIGVNYQVKELSNNTYASFLITDENGGSNIVQSEKENNTVKTEILTEVETVDENEEATITFTNTSEIIIKLKKQVEGNMGNKNDKFKFYVTIGENPEEVVELSHGEEKEYKMKHGTPYSIREEDYSSTGYRTYVGNSIIPSRNTSGTSDKNKEVIFRNVRGAAIPTEVRFYWWAGIPIILVPILWFIYKKKYKKDM